MPGPAHACCAGAKPAATGALAAAGARAAAPAGGAAWAPAAASAADWPRAGAGAGDAQRACQAASAPGAGPGAPLVPASAAAPQPQALVRRRPGLRAPTHRLAAAAPFL